MLRGGWQQIGWKIQSDKGLLVMHKRVTKQLTLLNTCCRWVMTTQIAFLWMELSTIHTPQSPLYGRHIILKGAWSHHVTHFKLGGLYSYLRDGWNYNRVIKFCTQLGPHQVLKKGWHITPIKGAWLWSCHTFIFLSPEIYLEWVKPET